MSDNEKRAHDLAIAVCMEICKMKRDAQIAAGETKIKTDYFEEYINAYEMSLEAFNEKFPNGK